MYSFFHSFSKALFDTLFPPLEHAKIVCDATLETLVKTCTPHVFGDTTALASYHTPLIRTLIHEAKFRHTERAISLLGELLGEYLNATFPNEKHPEIHLVPIPLSAERMRERGYNQTIEITRSARARVPHLIVDENILTKTRHTPSQTSLSRAERLKNLDGVFACGEHALPYETHLILFDDITTTGSTLAEASRTLRDAGFTYIDQLAIAH